MFSTSMLRVTTLALAGLVLVSTQDAEAQSRRGGGSRFERAPIARSAAVINRPIQTPDAGSRIVRGLPALGRAVRPITGPIQRRVLRPVTNRLANVGRRIAPAVVRAPGIARRIARPVTGAPLVRRVVRPVNRGLTAIGRRVVGILN